MNNIKCEICGGELLPTRECMNCGTQNAVEDSSDVVVNSPAWGRMTIDLSVLGDTKASVLRELRRIWRDLEATTAQMLWDHQPIPEQFSAMTFELIGPKSSYLVIRAKIDSDFCVPKEWLRYEPLRDGTLEALRKQD